MQRANSTHTGFTQGNAYAAEGGRARAAKLSPERRREIARAGWLGRVRRQFGGDVDAARAYIADLGRWAGDPYDGDPIPRVYQHPGEPSEYRARRYQLPLFGGTR
jgi:hypothetical protein